MAKRKRKPSATLTALQMRGDKNQALAAERRANEEERKAARKMAGHTSPKSSLLTIQLLAAMSGLHVPRR